MSLATPAQVKTEGGLIYQLFDLADDAALTTYLQDLLDDAEAWLSVYLGDSFGGTTAAETRLQTKGEVYLALAYATPTLKAKKIYGTHYPLDSEDSAAYENLLEQDWEGLARSLLAKWISIEPTGTAGGAQANFALPYFGTTESPAATTSDAEDFQLQEIADEARSVPEQVTATVT